MMNTFANGDVTSTAARSFQAVRNSRQEKFLLKQALQGIQKVARITSPIAARLAPVAAKALNSKTPRVEEVTVPLPIGTLLRAGEITAVQMEAEFFGTHEAETDVSSITAAREMALTEVLAAEANHSQNEAEAGALIGTALPIAIWGMGGQGALRPIVPALVRATARLVRLLRSQGAAGRQLLRLIPTILRRTIASLRAAQQAGRAIDSSLASRVMAAQAARVLANSQTMTRAMIRNAIIRQRTVAPAKPSVDAKVVLSNSRRFSKMAMQNEGLFEAPVSHEASPYSNPYSNPEFEDEWESGSNPELESAWEMHETSHYSNPYSNPEFEDEWETPETNPYSNPEFEDEWEMQAANPYSNPYSNPEFEDEWEMQAANPYSNPYSNPEFEDEGEYFFKKAFRTIGRGLKAAAKAAAPLAKRLAPIVAGKLAAMIPGVGVVAAPLAAKLTSALVKEGEMEAAQLEAEVFGTNAAEAEVANTEVAHEAALTEVLAAQAAEATTEAEAEMALGAALPITITIMGGRRALRPVMPVLAQANARLVGMLRRQGPAGRQLLVTVPAIQRLTGAILKAAARSGQPITGANTVRAMALATNRVLGNPQTVQRAIVRNAVLRQRTAPPNPRRRAAAANQYPTYASARR